MLAYLAALFAYAALGSLLLGVAGLLALVPSFRSFSRWLALGTLGSFPSVFAFQVIAFPLVGGIAFALGFLYGGKQLSEPFDIVVAMSGAGLMLATFALASLYGFVFGWRTANAVWEGARFQTLLANDPVCRRLAKYRTPLLLGFILVGSANGVQKLRWWLNSGITVEDVIGTYRVKNASTQALLEVNADRTWKYLFVGPPEFSKIWDMGPGTAQHAD
jgi:hypothetical protein